MSAAFKKKISKFDGNQNIFWNGGRRHGRMEAEQKRGERAQVRFECGCYLDHLLPSAKTDAAWLNVWAQKLENEGRMEHGARWGTVSDALAYFTHLTLDPGYALICYQFLDIHGTWGYTAALPQQAEKAPIFLTEHVSAPWAKPELPARAAPPLEAIFHDGTPEGAWEAIRCGEFLSALPYSRNVLRKEREILAAPPPDFAASWECFVEIPDWRPRAVIEKGGVSGIYAFRRETPTGMDSADGPSEIYLTRYQFQRRAALGWPMFDICGRSKYPTHIRRKEDGAPGGHSCVYTTSSIQIARENMT